LWGKKPCIDFNFDTQPNSCPEILSKVHRRILAIEEKKGLHIAGLQAQRVAVKKAGGWYTLVGIGGLTVLLDSSFPLLKLVVGSQEPRFWTVWMTLLCGLLTLLIVLVADGCGAYQR
jgi:hypothetical protein